MSSRKAYVPRAAATSLASARIPVTGAIIGVLIAERLVTGDGTGTFMINAQNPLDYDATLWSAALFVASVAALLYSVVVSALERVALDRHGARA